MHVSHDDALYVQRMIEDQLLEKDNVVCLNVKSLSCPSGEILTHVVRVGVLSDAKLDASYPRFYEFLGKKNAMLVNVQIEYFKTELPKALNWRAFEPLQRRPYSTMSAITPFRFGLQQSALRKLTSALPRVLKLFP